MRLPVRFRKQVCRLIRVAPPRKQYLVRKRNQPILIGAVQTDDGHRPFHDPGRDVRKSLESDLPFHRGLRHRKFIIPALEMVMA